MQVNRKERLDFTSFEFEWEPLVTHYNKLIAQALKSPIRLTAGTKQVQFQKQTAFKVVSPIANWWEESLDETMLPSILNPAYGCTFWATSKGHPNSTTSKQLLCKVPYAHEHRHLWDETTSLSYVPFPGNLWQPGWLSWFSQSSKKGWLVGWLVNFESCKLRSYIHNEWLPRILKHYPVEMPWVDPMPIFLLDKMAHKNSLLTLDTYE